MIKDLKSSATGEIVNPNIVKDNIPDGTIDNTKLDASINAKLSEIDGKANASDVYNKTEVDNKLSLKANASDVYNKTDVDNKLALKEDKSNKVSAFQSTPDNTHYPSEKLVKDNLDLKANASDTYNKTEVDNLLNDKADVSNVYSKTDVDTKLGNKLNSVLFLSGTSGTLTSDELTAITIGRCSIISLNNVEYYFDSIESATIYFKASPRVVRNGTTYDDVKQNTISINNNTGAWTYTDATIESLYNKNDTDTLLGAKANASTTYTKTEVDNKLLEKLSTAIDLGNSGSGTITSEIRAKILNGTITCVKNNGEYYLLTISVSNTYTFRKLIDITLSLGYYVLSRGYINVDVSYDTWVRGYEDTNVYDKSQVDALISGSSTPRLYMHKLIVHFDSVGTSIVNKDLVVNVLLNTNTLINSSNINTYIDDDLYLFGIIKDDNGAIVGAGYIAYDYDIDDIIGFFGGQDKLKFNDSNYVYTITDSILY